MAGTIIVSDIKTDTDNSFVVRANTGNVLFSVNTSGIVDVANTIPAGSITSEMIADGTVIASDVADGSITTAKIADGNVTAAKIDTVANTQVTGTMTTAQVADSAITTDKLADANVTVGKLATTVAGALGTRNLIINGDMRIAQRGTSKTGLTNGGTGYYTCDRWEWSEAANPSSVMTQTQDTDVPSGQGFANSWKHEVTTAQASLGSTDIVYLLHKIEAQNLQHLGYGTSNAKSVTLSFWVKSDKTGTYIAEFYQPDSSRILSKSYTINSADTWEKKTITVEGDTSGVINNDNGLGFQLLFWLAAGTSYTSGTLQTTWGSIVTGNRGPGQTNFTDTVGNYINITGVQLEVGDTATPFEHRPYDMELARCQRYYETGRFAFKETTGVANISSGMGGYTAFHTKKRAVPTSVITNTISESFDSSSVNNYVDGLEFNARATSTNRARWVGTYTADSEL